VILQAEHCVPQAHTSRGRRRRCPKRWQNAAANGSTALETRVDAQERDQPHFATANPSPLSLSIARGKHPRLLEELTRRSYGAPYHECAGQLRRAGRFVYSAKHTGPPLTTHSCLRRLPQELQIHLHRSCRPARRTESQWRRRRRRGI
jgi:hypothetical protein